MLRLRQPRPLFFLTSADLVLRSIVCSGVISSCSSLLPTFLLHRVHVRRRTKSEQRRNRGSQRTREILPPLSPDKQVRKRGEHEKMETWLETRLILVSMGQAFRVIGELNSSPACFCRKTPFVLFDKHHVFVVHIHVHAYTIRVYATVEINI